MRLLLNIPDQLESKLTAWRNAQKEESGKVVFRNTAVLELLTMALDGVEPKLPIVDRLAALEARVDELERKDGEAWQDGEGLT